MWAVRDVGVNLAETALWEVKDPVVLELDKGLKVRISPSLLLLLLSTGILEYNILDVMNYDFFLIQAKK